MNPQEIEDAMDKVSKALDTLKEHFDTGIIIVSRYDGSQDGTDTLEDSFGCDYSIYGQLKERVLEWEDSRGLAIVPIDPQPED